MIGYHRLPKITGLSVAGLFLLLGLIYLFLPIDRINSLITRYLEGQGLALSPAAHKTVVPGLAWNNLLLSSSQGTLVSCERLAIRPLLGPLLVGRLKLGASGIVRDGRFDLEYGLNGKEAFSLDSDGINLADIPFFKTILSAKVGGNLWIKGAALRSPKGLNGELRFELKQLEFSGVKLGGFSLPDAANLRSQGMIRITDGRLRVESFTLQGEGLHMRISGEIPSGDNAVNAPINLILEIMPKPDFMERQKLVFMLLTKFMISPGNFRIPIHGTLLKPAIL
jgi:type II secretion system protein N